MTSARAAVSSAAVSSSISSKNIKDATLYADSDCYVIGVMFKEGENIAPNEPIITVKGEENIVTIGVPGSDISKINANSKVTINSRYIGTVNKIEQYPNENTRNYNVDILVNDNNIKPGDTVDIRIGIGSDMCYYVPFTALFNSEGVDYVYAVDDENRVYKKEVEILGVDGENANVTLDMEGKAQITIISDGIKSINENDLVKFQ